MQLPRWIPASARVVARAAEEESGLDFRAHVGAVASRLSAHALNRPVGLLADNSPHWVAVDLAAHAAGVTLVPLPGFFSPAQLEHVVRSSGMRTLFCADSRAAAALGFSRELPAPGALRLFERAAASTAVEAALSGARPQKITFTSGSTGAPKGVCLAADEQVRTAQAVAEATAALGITRHLNLLPLSVLLENVAGIYAPLILGATCVCPPLAEVGLAGASGFDSRRCLDAIARHAPDSVILLPQMLRALVVLVERSPTAALELRSLKFMAVGGAATPRRLLARARDLGLPVYEGYGLSECASVVALNVPGADRPGSVGRALPGTRLRVAADGEVEVSGRGFAGYLGAPRVAQEPWLGTGDLGALDADGYLYIAGRKDNLLVTSYGRNVSPEWPESLLAVNPAVAQAAVFGAGRPHLAAVLVPSAADLPDAALHAAVEEVNAQLPDYARIGAWSRAAEPFSPGNGQATANGRLRREAVWARYCGALNRLYETESEHT